jgi:hypothetical protein
MLALLRHFLLPHHSNNHRPKILHHQSLFIVLVLLCVVGLSVSIAKREYPAVLGISANVSVQDLLRFTNEQRESHGLTALKLDPELSNAAAAKAQHMFHGNYWAHISPDGTTPWFFIKKSGYEYLYAGENLARGYTTAPEVVDAWMASPSHRENILSPQYNDVGFAIATGSLTGSDTVLVVQMFGTRYISDDTDTLSESFTGPLPTSQSFEQGAPATHMGTVASLQNKPLVDSKNTTRTLAYFLLILLILVLVVDEIVVARTKITRVVAHNMDHLIFLTALLLAAIIIGKGVIL